MPQCASRSRQSSEPCAIAPSPRVFVARYSWPPASCSGQFAIAGASQGVPRRVLAPQRSALVKLQGGLPCLSQPRLRRGSVIGIAPVVFVLTLFARCAGASPGPTSHVRRLALSEFPINAGGKWGLVMGGEMGRNWGELSSLLLLVLHVIPTEDGWSLFRVRIPYPLIP
jgi:hypothetical protein